MPQTRAIELTEENLDVIANSGVITRADVQALYESRVVYKKVNTPRVFIIDYVDAKGEICDWIAPTIEFFEENFRWTEPAKSGFRYCKLK